MKSYEIGPATYFLQKHLVKLTKIGRERNKPPHTPTRPAGQRRHRTPTARATARAKAAGQRRPRPGPTARATATRAKKCDENVTCLGKCETHTWTKMKII